MSALTSFAEFLAPVTVETFRSQYLGRAPLHIPGPREKAASIASWDGFNTMLGMESHWTESNLRLVLNSHPIYPEHYVDEVKSVSGLVKRASPAKVAVFAAMGASIVANDVQDVSPSIRVAASMLGDALMGHVNANIYCSFQHIQAFGSHYDLHEVFAVQCEGEKTWRLYSGREENPVDAPPLDEETKALMENSKGHLIAEVRMSPGDVLYIPRGCYHDAVASSEASLHVTFSVTPLNGRDMLEALFSSARADTSFGAYLPDHRDNGGAVLQAHLSRLGAQLADICRSPAFLQAIASRQRSSHQPPFRHNLPSRLELRWFEIRDRTAELRTGPEGASLFTVKGRVAVGLMGDAVIWMLSRPAFSIEEVAARYPHLTEAEIVGLVDAMRQGGVVAPYTPPLGS